jgi:glycosyltransferase involved in cell wall biosynthesis
MNEDIAAVFRKSPDGSFQAHPVHQEWAESIDADPVGINTRDFPTTLGRTTLADAVNCALSRPLPEHDVYLFEAPGMLYILPFLKRTRPNSTVLYLHTSWRLRGSDAYSFAEWSSILRPFAQAERTVDSMALRRLLRRYVDGVITVSELTRSDIVRTFDGPVGVIRPFIEDETYEELTSVSPSYGSSTLVTVGTYREHKGTDRLVNSWEYIRTKHPEAELHLIGEGYPDRFSSVPGVKVRGYVESLADAFNRASGYVHPARFDASPVSTLEAMAANLPPLVTLETGTRTEAAKISERFVLPSNQKSLVSGVSHYLSISPAEQKQFGQEANNIASGFRKSTYDGRFGDVFNAVLDLSSGFNNPQ